MQLSETENVYPVEVGVRDSVVGRELQLFIVPKVFVALDQTTAAELLPILEHFIKTGELPETK